MSKTNSPPGNDPATRTQESKSTDTNPAKPRVQPQDVGRETIESIAFAFVLALLFRSFVAEAFVIPTGSMAPTLYGRNKDVVCSGCQHSYAIGASEEIDDRSGFLSLSQRIRKSMCPNCRHMNDVYSLPVFKGDRILVNKSSYHFGEPDRWDVIVFRYPEDTEKNYIKRLVGLPGETIRIERGDVYARKGSTGEFNILRKQDPNKQKLLQQVVYDDRHPPVKLLQNGWPESWQAVEPGEGGWKHDPKTRKFDVAQSDDLKTIRYQHLVPSMGDWEAAEMDKPVTADPRPELVTDFCGYNATIGPRGDLAVQDDCYWVGDLTISCSVTIGTVAEKNAKLILELNEGVRRYRCKIDVNTGMATLTRTDELAADPDTAPEIEMASAQTSVKGAGTYTLRFANVDDRLCLWVNESWLNQGLVQFGSGANYEAPSNRRPQELDLAPVAFSVQGLSASVSKLLIERDIYYRAERIPNDGGTYPDPEVSDSSALRNSLKNPLDWGAIYKQSGHDAEFHELGPNEFFVMGDNSPRSQDSRLWPNHARHAPNRHAVGRQALIGKAFFIYWPHGVPFGIPFVGGSQAFTLLGHKLAPPRANDPDHNPKDVEEAAKYAEYSIPFYPQWWRWKRIR